MIKFPHFFDRCAFSVRRSTKDRRELLSSKHATTKTGAHRSRRAVQYMSQEERLREAEKMEVINKESLGEGV